MVKDTNKRIMITLPVELLAEVTELCRMNNCTVSEYVKALIKADQDFMNELAIEYGGMKNA